jgi:DNA (cytosine-5)-methyltransferase 1
MIDLFCGCGGLGHGFREDFHVVAAVDAWAVAVDSYRANADPATLAVCADLAVTTAEAFQTAHGPFPPITLLTGGIPCQGVSISGRRDTRDPRNQLYLAFFGWVETLRPRVFVIENVIGILSMLDSDGTKLFDRITARATALGYTLHVMKLYAKDYGVPQIRRRVIVLGFRDAADAARYVQPPPVTPVLPVSAVLEPVGSVPASYFLSPRAVAGIAQRRATMEAKGFGFGAVIIDPARPAPTISARYWKDGYDALVRDTPAGADDAGVRRLTLRELLRIQSFPDDYVLCGTRREQIMQIGNAVACAFARHVARSIAQVLEM